MNKYITMQELYEVPDEKMQNETYGWNHFELQDLNPNDIYAYNYCKEDMANVFFVITKAGSPRKWAKKYVGEGIKEPIKVAFCEDGKFYVEDGHHRWYASKLLKISIKAEVEIKRNVFKDYVEYLKRQGYTFDEEVYLKTGIKKEG